MFFVMLQKEQEQCCQLMDRDCCVQCTTLFLPCVQYPISKPFCRDGFFCRTELVCSAMSCFALCGTPYSVPSVVCTAAIMTV